MFLSPDDHNQASMQSAEFFTHPFPYKLVVNTYVIFWEE